MDAPKLTFPEHPFPAAINAARYLPIGAIESARARLQEAIDHRECPAMLVGPPGTGKSLVCQLLAEAYQNEFDVVLLSETRLCTRRALLQHLLHHLGLPYADRSEGELRLALIDRATQTGPESKAGLLIIVDEAQGLPGRLLEELRMISGIVRGGKSRVQWVLVGASSLDERLAQPRMEPLAQRIGTRCYLHPLSQGETYQYVRESLRRVGLDPSQLIDDHALQSVYFASDGIPRLINQTMSRAVSLAESAGLKTISSQVVEQAWAELQQLPGPGLGLPEEFRGNSWDSARDQAALPHDEEDSDQPATIEFVYGEPEPAELLHDLPTVLPNDLLGDLSDQVFDGLSTDNSLSSYDAVSSEGEYDEPESYSETRPFSIVRANNESVDSTVTPRHNPLAETTDYDPETLEFNWSAEPVAAEPVAAEPVAAEPVAAEPAAAEPVAATPVAAEPVAAEPVVIEPVTVQPVALDPTPLGQQVNSTAFHDDADLVSLFGDDFDDEQIIPVVVADRPAAFGVSRELGPLELIETFGPTAGLDVPNEMFAQDPAADELAVHQEVVAINQEVAEGALDFHQFMVANESPQADPVAGWEATAETAAPQFSSEANEAFNADDFQPRIVEVPPSELSLDTPLGIAADEGEAGCGTSGGDITVLDDSDLLVIEDDLSLDDQPESLAPRGPRDLEPVDGEHDAQSILTRLRKG
ncbi:ExeA family protein [Planctomycetaceae bacterium SH139]